MRAGWRRSLWIAGWPVRAVLLLGIRGYRLSVGQVIGGGCRFHPTCSTYAEQAVAELGAVRGSALTVWRVLRCSPLSSGGVDYPPSARVYEGTVRPMGGAGAGVGVGDQA